MGQSLALRTCFSSLDAAACVCNVMVDFCFFFNYILLSLFFFIELQFLLFCVFFGGAAILALGLCK